jgi:hypothetical protein
MLKNIQDFSDTKIRTSFVGCFALFKDIYILRYHPFTSCDASTAVSVHHVMSCHLVMNYFKNRQVIICNETTRILRVLFHVALTYIHAFTSRDVNTTSFQMSNS